LRWAAPLYPWLLAATVVVEAEVVEGAEGAEVVEVAEWREVVGAAEWAAVVMPV